MTGPPWLPAFLAALMLLIAACSAARLVISRLRRRPSEPATDILHVLMGLAMAGMLKPRLSAVPPAALLAVFGLAALWFAGQAVRMRDRQHSAEWCRAHPAPHAVECAAMCYMLWPARPGGDNHAVAMAGMSAAPAANPALALVLSLFMLGYILWTSDQLTVAWLRGSATTGKPLTTTATAAVNGAHADASAVAVIAPRVAAFSKITMAAAMAYMLIAMV